MWTANITGIEKNALDFDMTVEFSNGDVTKVVAFKLSEPASITQVIKNQLDQYQKIDDLNVPLGKVDFQPAPAPVPPSEKEVTDKEYQLKRAVLVGLKQDLDLGLISQDEYSTALNEAKSLK